MTIRSNIVLLLMVATVGHAVAQQEDSKTVSKVRQAAIDKMQSKLGNIRGSIKPKQHNIFLTGAMIEQLKPIRPGQQPTVRSEETPTELTTYVRGPSLEPEEETVVPSFAETYDTDVLEIAVSKQILEDADKQVNFVEEILKQAPKVEPTVVQKVSKAIRPEPQPIRLEPNETRSERLQREIFKAVRNPLSTKQVDRGLITNSVKKSALPNTSNIDEIMKAVDKMIAHGD